MARKLKYDKLLFLATLLLVGTSVVMVYSASAALAMQNQQPSYYFLFKQVTWVALGVCLLSLVMRVDYRNLKQPVIIWTALGVSIAALVAVFLVGPEISGSRRWFALGGIGVQPSELAKVAVIIFTAATLERRMDKIDQIAYAVGPIALVTAVVCGLIVIEPDFGTAFTVLLIVGVMVFVAGLHYRYLTGSILVMAPVLFVILAAEPYRRQRLFAFLDPWADPQGGGWQIIQSEIAVGPGHLFGEGLMGGVQKLFYLPAPHTDFIYAVIAEETGLLGATAVLGCFAVIIWRGLRVTVGAPDRFGGFLALGITTMLGFQAFFNISVVLGLLPTKGISLPFVSAGGSSLLAWLLGMGILLNVSQHASADV